MKLVILPRETVEWESFTKNAPPFSIALDGYVRGAPFFLPDGPYANFNHHEDVDRLATRSTAGQVFMAVKMGFMEAFPPERLTVFVNDCDQDVCLAWWLLKNYTRMDRNTEPLINRLVWVSDVMDTCAGAYPVQPHFLRELAWIYEPYVHIRKDVPFLTEKQMRFAIELVCARISQYAVGQGETITPEVDYDIIYKKDKWAIVREKGVYARTAMRDDGIEAFVSVTDCPKDTDGDGNCHNHPKGCPRKYSIGLLTLYTRFPLLKLYDALNNAEVASSKTHVTHPLLEGEKWGGSNTIGGSPRQYGSFLTPEEVEKVIEQVLFSLVCTSGDHARHNINCNTCGVYIK